MLDLVDRQRCRLCPGGMKFILEPPRQVGTTVCQNPEPGRRDRNRHERAFGPRSFQNVILLWLCHVAAEDHVADSSRRKWFLRRGAGGAWRGRRRHRSAGAGGLRPMRFAGATRHSAWCRLARRAPPILSCEAVDGDDDISNGRYTSHCYGGLPKWRRSVSRRARGRRAEERHRAAANYDRTYLLRRLSAARAIDLSATTVSAAGISPKTPRSRLHHIRTHDIAATIYVAAGSPVAREERRGVRVWSNATIIRPRTERAFRRLCARKGDSAARHVTSTGVGHVSGSRAKPRPR